MLQSGKNPTIRDVARAAGVSIATVSHVLNDRREKVSSETRERVLKVVRELRYRLPPKEEGQTAMRTFNVAVTISDMAVPISPFNTYLAETILRSAEVCLQRGYSLTVVAERVWDQVGQVARRRFDGRCDGILMVAPSALGDALQQLWERGLPVVSMGSRLRLQGISTVDVDNLRVGEIAAELLLKHGHRKVAYVASGADQASTYERFEGLLQTFEAAGLAEGVSGLVLDAQPDGTAVRSSPSRSLRRTAGRLRFVGRKMREADAATLMELLGEDVTGLFFWHDALARTFVTRFTEAGVRIPEDLSVIGVDNNPYFTEPD
ncbi:MAG: LacI family DNA-binding transcriptional regulator, partial [Fimbriimonadales bacterium]